MVVPFISKYNDFYHLCFFTETDKVNKNSPSILRKETRIKEKNCDFYQQEREVL